jgi:hypothetical protein
MNHSPNQQPGRLDDPRTRPDFQPLHYPRLNGQDTPPVGATGRNDRIKLEFLAVYYGLNCENARLLDLKNQPDSDRRAEAEKNALQAVEKLLIARDQLEDEYAPLGVVAEPFLNDGFTVAVRVSFGNVDAAGRLRSEMFTIATTVPIPLPGRVRFKDLPIKIAGPGINPD